MYRVVRDTSPSRGEDEVGSACINRSDALARAVMNVHHLPGDLAAHSLEPHVVITKCGTSVAVRPNWKERKQHR
jgi:hypothetical protein